MYFKLGDNTTRTPAWKAEVDSLKTSVSNGKSLIASAITDKGVSTASDATFQVMADNIENIPTYNEVCDVITFTGTWSTFSCKCMTAPTLYGYIRNYMNAGGSIGYYWTEWEYNSAYDYNFPSSFTAASTNIDGINSVTFDTVAFDIKTNTITIPISTRSRWYFSINTIAEYTKQTDGSILVNVPVNAGSVNHYTSNKPSIGDSQGCWSFSKTDVSDTKRTIQFKITGTLTLSATISGTVTRKTSELS